MEEKRLKDFVAMSQLIGSRNDYVQGGGGNTSVKLGAELMAIKASGYSLKDVTEDAGFSVVSYSALQSFFNSTDCSSVADPESLGSDCVKKSVRIVEGLPQLRPSVETGFHSLLKTFVIHTHSIYANMAACSCNCDEILETALRDADYTYTALNYEDPGTKLALAFKRAFEKEYPDVFFMKNHGVVVHSDDWEKCVAIHEDLNQKLSLFFHTKFGSMDIQSLSESRISLPEIKGCFADEAAAEEVLFLHPLFPDQIVFLDKNVLVSQKTPLPEQCCLNIDTLELSCTVPPKKAIVIAEVISAVCRITTSVKTSGYSLRFMEEQDTSFINNWESEKYRKTIH